MASFTLENPIFTALDYRRALEALRNGVPNRGGRENPRLQPT